MKFKNIKRHLTVSKDEINRYISHVMVARNAYFGGLHKIWDGLATVKQDVQSTLEHSIRLPAVLRPALTIPAGELSA